MLPLAEFALQGAARHFQTGHEVQKECFVFSPSSKRARALTVVVAVSLSACIGTGPALEELDFAASDDPAVIARGHYLVYGPAHCASCHGDPAAPRTPDAGEPPLSGGRHFDVGPLGTVVAPNITQDPEAGIGARSDATLVRSLRYGIAHDGRTLVPIMPFADMADRDLHAVISYLRTVTPVPEPAPPNSLSWLGAVALRLIVEPSAPSGTPAHRVTPERSPEYGRYLAHTVANCHGCHTRRSKLTGSYVGPPFAGGMELEEAGRTFVSPNLTPVEGGVLHGVSEAEFIRWFRARGHAGGESPMPWRAYSRMTDLDLSAIYRYLGTIPAAETPS
jgi:mono/diheme cytochrome c family protein